MGININQKVRVVPTGKGNKVIGGQTATEKFGRVIFINKNLVVIRYKKYREAFNLADLVSPQQYKLLKWTGDIWTQIEAALMEIV
jgi:hypothetical protein